tara:strand:- start:2382 stop:4607 length:2226 start_codon:yes stop_codon:yes gene_type:complete
MEINKFNQTMKYLTRPAERPAKTLYEVGPLAPPDKELYEVGPLAPPDKKLYEVGPLAPPGNLPVTTDLPEEDMEFQSVIEGFGEDLDRNERQEFDEGGRIGFDVGGFGESKVLRQFLEDRIQSGNTTFESIKDLTKQANVDLGERAVIKVLKAYPNKFFTDVAGTKFPLGYDDKNLSKLKEGMNLLKEWEKNPTPENWIKTFQVTKPGGQTGPSKFGQGLRNYLQGKKGEGNTFHKYFKKINFNNTIKKEVKTYDKKLFNKIKSGFGSAAARISTLETSAAVARTVGETFLLDPENTDITDVAKALHGKKFDKASNVKKIEMLQDARNGVQKFYESLTTNRPIGLKKKIKAEQFQDILDNIESNSSDFGFQEGQIREYKMKVRDDLLKVKDPSKFFRNLRNNVEVPKGKIIDEVFSLSATYKRAPGYLDQIQFISNKINKKKSNQIDLPLQNILTALDEGKTTVKYNKKQMPIEKAIQQFNKKSRSFAKVNKIKTPQINLGGKFDPSQYKNFSPASQKNIADVFKDKNYFLTTTKTKAPSTILTNVIPRTTPVYSFPANLPEMIKPLAQDVSKASSAVARGLDNLKLLRPLAYETGVGAALIGPFDFLRGRPISEILLDIPTLGIAGQSLRAQRLRQTVGPEVFDKIQEQRAARSEGIGGIESIMFEDFGVDETPLEEAIQARADREAEVAKTRKIKDFSFTAMDTAGVEDIMGVKNALKKDREQEIKRDESLDVDDKELL